MNKITTFISSVFLFTAVNISASDKINSVDDLIFLENGFSQTYYNCEKRGFEIFTYEAYKDGGNNKRYSPFHTDNRLPKHCQQKKTSSYKKNKITKAIHKANYDRGHGLPQNVVDDSLDKMKKTNLMSNIVPQNSTQNRTGLWRHTEKITECHRDNHSVKVVGGNIWGDDIRNDLFILSHGVITPDYLFKIILIDDENIMSWIIPNDNKAKASNADNYLVTVREIEEKLGYELPFIDDSLKSKKAKKTPQLKNYCDYS